jgi:hypothetical protein
LVCWALAAFFLMPATAQQTAGGHDASTATVTFALDFPQSNPAHYSITVDAAGHARYESVGKIAEDSEDDKYESEFEMSPGNRERIFECTKRAGYFSGNIDGRNRKVAFTGEKTLSYRHGEQLSSARYNYSDVEPVRQLTELFQGMAATLEFGRRLTYYHRYQKLALDDELKQMEEQAKANQLSEIQATAPVLREIAEDASVINGVRVRARELIEMGSGAAGR